MKIIAFSKNKFYENAKVGEHTVALVENNLSPKLVKSNNADILILDGKSIKALYKAKFFRHAPESLVPLTPCALLMFIIWGFKYLVRGRLKIVGLTNVKNANGKSKLHIRVMRNLKKSYASERSFFPKSWSNKQLLSWLDEQGVNYIVMRWYDDVISEQDVNDIDILMADDDAKRIRELLSKELGTKPVDIFDLGGSDLDQVAYYPPFIAKQLLANKVRAGSNLPGYIPAPADEFKSLAYHAIIRKGYKSGLQLKAGDNITPSGKLYKKLVELKGELKLTCNLDMLSLFEYLKEENYLPPLDMLVKLKQKNKWLEEHYYLFEKEHKPLKGHYFSLIIREVVEKWGNLEALEKDIQDAGFEIIHSQNIPQESREEISQQIRGGNWSAGPWPVSGGRPFHIYVVYDNKPLPLKGKMKKTHPMVSSARILFKQEWRNRINAMQGKGNEANFVHTSDNNAETVEYLEHISPNGIEAINKKEETFK